MWNKTLGFAIAVSVLLTACDAAQVSTEKQPPTVESVQPAENAKNVPIETRIEVVFSEPIPPATVRRDRFTVEFAGTDSLERGSYEVEGATATFIPRDSLLDSNVKYRVTVDSVSDMHGNKMQTQKVWEFTTADIPPTIESVFPAEGATGVALDTTVTVEFSEPVDPQSVNQNNFEVVFARNDSVEQGNRTVNGSMIEFMPQDTTFDNNATYKVTVKNIKDMGGKTLQQSRTWEFTTTDTTSSQ